jgi:GNAT superfamily N-acetyltransferase
MTENNVLDTVRRPTTPQDSPILAGQVTTVPVSQGGLIAYVDGVPAGWVATGETGSAGVWAVTRMAVRPGYRGRGLTYHLAKAAVGFARERGAHVLEASPVLSHDAAWGEPLVGAQQVFADVGIRISHNGNTSVRPA